MSSLYLKRYAWPDPVLADYSKYSAIEMVVVIPCHNEPNILLALNALHHCTPPTKPVLVLVIVNESEKSREDISAQNAESVRSIRSFKSWFQLEVTYTKLPARKAGVGLARKIGMDEAVRIFRSAEKEGVIICFDADCQCTPNYFLAIESFYTNPKNQLGLIYYEHPLEKENQDAIIHYELFLRYYIDALRYAGFPHAIQTLGSCITVRSEAYEKQGGMNTRKAGEDFYFIHKVMPLGGTGEINETCVIPSARVSGRVPFGTGHAINKYLNHNEEIEAYAPQTFDDLMKVFQTAHKLFDGYELSELTLPKSVAAFYKENQFEKALCTILDQSNNLKNFNKRFFAWWDAFRVLKFVHFARDHFFPNISLDRGTTWLGQEYFNTNLENASMKDRLIFYRKMDRNASYYIK